MPTKRILIPFATHNVCFAMSILFKRRWILIKIIWIELKTLTLKMFLVSSSWYQAGIFIKFYRGFQFLSLMLDQHLKPSRVEFKKICKNVFFVSSFFLNSPDNNPSRLSKSKSRYIHIINNDTYQLCLSNVVIFALKITDSKTVSNSDF